MDKLVALEELFTVMKTVPSKPDNTVYKAVKEARLREKIGADCIVSRDKGFIKANSEINVISPSQLLAKF